MQPTVERLHALDAVRASALLAGVLLHGIGPWVEAPTELTFSETPSNTAAAISWAIHIFRMAVFFLIAGYFGRLATERRGTKGFIKDRAKRIALPLVVGIPLIVPLASVGWALGALATGMSFTELRDLAQSALAAPHSPSPHYGAPVLQVLGHLWFLYYLLMFYAVALTARAAARALDRDGKALRGIDRVLHFLMGTGLAAIVLALPVAAWYVFLWPEWPGWTGLPSPGSLVVSVPAFLAFGLFFATGWLLNRQTDLLLRLRERWVPYAIVGIALAVAAFVIAGPTPHWSAYLQGWELRIYAVTYITAAWCLSFALIGMALRFLSTASPVRRYIADSSYWMYLMHLVPIAFFVALMHPLDWHWSVKYGITVIATVAVLLLTYEAFVRYTFIGAVLNGRRVRPKKAALQGADDVTRQESESQFSRPERDVLPVRRSRID
ncbi:acyltransferase family protein [Mycobacterium sp. GA-1199]|uniref:acyltransferase family protein n=1 Tax=Mycobacterium sp. GA-1199 TaxID=1772287 RepID=UPI000AFD4356|nr:acyltransferase family protein [Mycobacterium sp. GA-1199]